MSAFMVSKATMDRVVSDWKADIYGPGHNMSAEQLDEVGRKLFKMNADAVFQRYPNHNRLEVERYSFGNYSCPWGPIERLKAMQCLKYQCSEGNVPETNPLYKELEQRIAARAQEIVRSLPEYNAAPWDAAA